MRGAYRTVAPGSRAGSPITDVNAKNPPPLPAVLEETTPTTRIVYCYLEPYGKVRATVGQLEANIS